MEDITVVVVNYNGIRTVVETIESIYAMEGICPQVILVDDGSTDGSPQAVRERFPDLRMIVKPANTRQVNSLRNEGIRAATTEKVFITDNDIRFDPKCLQEMLAVMNADDQVACCIPRLMYREQPDRINMCGGRIHYIGAYISPERDKTLAEAHLQTGFGVGGGIALFRRAVFEQVGGFDEDYMLAWGDDGELQQRMLLAGYQSRYVHTAFALHEAKPFTKARHYRAIGQTYNRWLLLLTHYDVRTLVLMFPMLFIYELVQFTFLCINGLPSLYFQGNAKVIRALPLIRSKRRRIQAMKRAADRDIVFAGPILVTTSRVGFGNVVRLAIGSVSAIFSVYWKLITPLLRRAAA